ncbi:hypothetical protein OUZ56_012744 [Daphnia magna]|uniref:Uncharacterized protein n=1 Tax=Daphnia magna TaxID=35525 RepID=A0ABQ9Z3X6_9CRUS|nr:hypothetical protein OUZ56_012744 [Daphnia magna]
MPIRNRRPPARCHFQLISIDNRADLDLGPAGAAIAYLQQKILQQQAVADKLREKLFAYQWTMCVKWANEEPKVSKSKELNGIAVIGYVSVGDAGDSRSKLLCVDSIQSKSN